MTVSTRLHPSQLPLDGGINFRDLGGNSAQDGRRIKPGLLFRAGSLDRSSARSDLVGRLRAWHAQCRHFSSRDPDRPDALLRTA